MLCAAAFALVGSFLLLIELQDTPQYSLDYFLIVETLRS